jgi:hypothetical protein
MEENPLTYPVKSDETVLTNILGDILKIMLTDRGK